MELLIGKQKLYLSSAQQLTQQTPNQTSENYAK